MRDEDIPAKVAAALPCLSQLDSGHPEFLRDCGTRDYQSTSNGHVDWCPLAEDNEWMHAAVEVLLREALDEQERKRIDLRTRPFMVKCGGCGFESIVSAPYVERADALTQARRAERERCAQFIEEVRAPMAPRPLAAAIRALSDEEEQ